MRIVDIGGGTGKDQALIKAVTKINSEGYTVDLFSETTENLDGSEKAFLHTLAKVKQADFVILHFHGAIPNFKKFSRLQEVLEKIDAPIFLLSEINEEMQEFRYLFTLSDTKYEQVNRYVRLGGEENARRLVFWALHNIGGKDVGVSDPIFPRTEGIYHPDYDMNILHEEFRKTLDPK